MLARLNIPFSVCPPELDESALPGETPLALARRLALQKARAIARQEPDAVVIGADQVLDFNGIALGKPGNADNARRQLIMLSGQTVTFQSAIALVTPRATRIRVSPSRATFRRLSDAQIEQYLQIDQPFDTAGSAKAESLGISLLESLQSDDPTAIIGLPLIELTRLLSLAGIDPLTPNRNAN
ncbi:MAG: Maf family protein [Burkholderiaceae bacterium]|nr:Maf family protein [Burkholderiaceae bacterium]MCD8517554.1 Maf family protein [Burkholderiaceae bacterium]MCD8537935.1 Maf family protein [Burkholderiaceae bacterium]MCD8565869.1 Maf family protein [Burkholderiaceae bacterium]